MNGTWFGIPTEAVDAVPATPFTVEFVNLLNNASETATIQAGRYTPAELAQAFTS